MIQINMFTTKSCLFKLIAICSTPATSLITNTTNIRRAWSGRGGGTVTVPPGAAKVAIKFALRTKKNIRGPLSLLESASEVVISVSLAKQ